MFVGTKAQLGREEENVSGNVIGVGLLGALNCCLFGAWALCSWV